MGRPRMVNRHGLTAATGTLIPYVSNGGIDVSFEKRWILLLGAALMLIALMLEKELKAKAHPDLIRLHILANSDAPYDQELKHKVRDRLLAEFSPAFKPAGTAAEARELINNRLEDIEAAALEEIAANGYDYTVEARLGIFDFPTKVYGDDIYPAGRYEALRVIIGEGQGANWWCVMFPPLCFVDISSGVTRGQEVSARSGTREADKEGLSAEDKEYGKDRIESCSADSSGENERQVVYKFKIAEWFKAIWSWIKGLFS